MDDRDLIVLAQKLHGFEGKIPWTQYFATLLRFMALQEKGGAGNRIRSTSKGRRRVIVASWLWPCHYIPEIEAALKDPSPERLRALLAFFRGVAVVHHLQAGRKLRKELSEVFAKEELPFTLVALAHLERRPRCLTPRPATAKAKDISDVELYFNWQLWRIAKTVHEELSAAFLQHGIAKVCPYCGRLFVEVKRSYCSDRCRKAYHNGELYRRKQSKSRAGLVVEIPTV